MSSNHRSTSTSPISVSRNKMLVPLSDHGLPKTPHPLGPSTRPHRFSGKDSKPIPIISSSSMASRSPGPMSARSFGTFIDSEPSTPAYSPRSGTDWDSSTLMLISPASTAPSIGLEPEWEMMSPMRNPSKSSATSMADPSHTKQVSSSSLSPSLSHFVKAMQMDAQKEGLSPGIDKTETGVTDEANAEATMKKKEGAEGLSVAPIEKLVMRMKSMLRKKTTTGDKKSNKRGRYAELDRMETVHWTDL